MASNVNTDNIEGNRADLAREEAMLSHYLHLLDEFSRRDLQPSLTQIRERCHVLRDRIFAQEQLIANKSQPGFSFSSITSPSNSKVDRDHLAREYVLSDTGIVKHEDFVTWLQSEYFSRPHVGQIPKLKRKNSQPLLHDRKRSYVSLDNEFQPTVSPPKQRQPSFDPSMPALVVQPKHQGASIASSSTSNTLTTHSFPLEVSHRHSKGESLAGNVLMPHMESKPKFAHATSDDTAGSKPTRLATIPCLRCKVLKRKCDTSQQCHHCPKQSDQNENDFWKVLGCFRGPLSELAGVVFRADFYQLPTKVYGFTISLSTTALVLTKPSRLFHLARKMADCVQAKDFAALKDTSWEDMSSRRYLSMGVSTGHGRPASIPPESDVLGGCETAWSLLRVVNTDPIYLGQTGYNLFTLLRLGHEMPPESESSCRIFQQAEILVCATGELHLQVSRYALAESSNTEDSPVLELVDIKNELETFLVSFERICSGRGRLSGHTQLACFHALLLLDVFRSLLIDTCSIMTVRPTETGQPESLKMSLSSDWKDLDAVRINAMYKVIVSVFAWASKNDLMLDPCLSMEEEEDSKFSECIESTRRMLRVENWQQQGIKGCKDFLLTLGSCLLDESKYNGFFIQRFGIYDLSTRPVAKESDLEMTSRFQSEYTDHLSAPFPSALSAVQSRTSNGWKTNAKHLSKELTWEHATVAQDRVQFASEGHGHKSEDEKSRHGSRIGKLTPEAAEKARKMRKLGACWRCWVQKIPCSIGKTCERCDKISREVPDSHFLCSRAGFKDYSEIFFPDYLHDHLDMSKLKSLMTDSQNAWTNTTISTAVTFDGKCSMCFHVSVFASNEQYPKELVRRTVDGSVQTTPSHPVGLLGTSSSAVKRTVQGYLKDVLVNNAPFIHSEKGASTAVKSIISRLYRFSLRMEGEGDVLRQAFLILIVYNVMGKTLLFTEPGLSRIESSLPQDARSRVHSAASSWFMDITVNNAIRTLAVQVVKDLLGDLERAVRSRARDQWARVFAVILVLCSCVEEMQNCALASLDIEEKINSTGDSNHRKKVLHACTSLEEQPLRIIADIFHSIYRSNANSSYGNGRNDGFNPLKQMIRNGCRIENGGDLGLESHIFDLVRDVGQIILHSYQELQAAAGPANLEGSLEEVTKYNLGRLASQFLLSFVDDATIEEGLRVIDSNSTREISLAEATIEGYSKATEAKE